MALIETARARALAAVQRPSGGWWEDNPPASFIMIPKEQKPSPAKSIISRIKGGK
jgi:hypothetical protein